MKYLALLSISCFLLIGCSSPVFNVSATHEKIYRPEVGDIVTVNVGEAMIESGISVTRKALDVMDVSRIGRFTIMPGSFPIIGNEGNYQYFNQTPSGGSIHAGIADLHIRSAVLRYNKSTEEFCVLRPGDPDMCGWLNYHIEDKLVDDSRYRVESILYLGKVGDVISVEYREQNTTQNDVIRPLVFDQKTSNIIGYKNVRLEILESNSFEITYKVLSHF